jgi:GMP synthase (glutamine-hydrolysing)
VSAGGFAPRRCLLACVCVCIRVQPWRCGCRGAACGGISVSRCTWSGAPSGAELNCFCELYACNVKASVIAGKNIVGVVLSGGPSSVYEDGAPHVDDSVWALIAERRLPVLGICYGAQEICNKFGGLVERAPKREFGYALLEATAPSGLFKDVSPSSRVRVRRRCAAVPSPRVPMPGRLRCHDTPRARGDDARARALSRHVADVHPVCVRAQVWMSHSDKVTRLPEGYETIGSTESTANAAFHSTTQPIYAIQFHPEVTHSAEGKVMLRNFVIDICGCPAVWTMASFVDEAIASIRTTVGETGHVIGAVSGGVDSTVAAVLLHRAIGARFHAVLVDNGLLRKDEATKVRWQALIVHVSTVCTDSPCVDSVH